VRIISQIVAVSHIAHLVDGRALRDERPVLGGHNLTPHPRTTIQGLAIVFAAALSARKRARCSLRAAIAS